MLKHTHTLSMKWMVWGSVSVSVSATWLKRFSFYTLSMTADIHKCMLKSVCIHARAHTHTHTHVYTHTLTDFI